MDKSHIKIANILSLSSTEAMDYFMKSERYHGFELIECKSVGCSTRNSKSVRYHLKSIGANIAAMRGKYHNRVGSDKGGFYEFALK